MTDPRATYSVPVRVNVQHIPQTDIDEMLSQVRRGLLQVIKAIEAYQAARQERDLQSDDN